MCTQERRPASADADRPSVHRPGTGEHADLKKMPACLGTPVAMRLYLRLHAQAACGVCEVCARTTATHPMVGPTACVSALSAVIHSFDV